MAMMIAPVTAYADKGNNSSPVKMEGSFCSKFNAKSLELDRRMGDNESKNEQKKDANAKKLAEQRIERDLKLEKHRADAEEKRGEQFIRLQAKATTDAQKAAVTAYQNAMTAAIKARKTAVDAAMKAFRDGVDKIIASRKTSLNAIVSSYRNAVDAAIARAKADCATGVTPETVRTTFKARMEAARVKMQTDRKALDKSGSQIEALTKIRKTAVEKAMSDFKATAESARIALKAALK